MMAGNTQMIHAPALAEQLNLLLSESVEAAKIRGRDAFIFATQPFTDRFVVFGAGEMGRKVFAGLRRIGQPPVAFADNNPALHGTEVDGLRVYSPAKAAEVFGDNSAFILSIWGSAATDRTAQRARKLRDLGCLRTVNAGLLFWRYPSVYLPYFAMDLPHKALGHASEIKKAFELMADEESRQEFVAQLRFRLLMDFEAMSDASISELFEPRQGEVRVDCVTLDESLKDRNPSFIKFDIEGAELDALEGARDVISRCRPVLAVSVYHEQAHLWQIPLALSEICSDYSYYLRPHGTEGWDLVCYAVPNERVTAR